MDDVSEKHEKDAAHDVENDKNVPEVIKSVPSTSTKPKSDKSLFLSQRTQVQDEEDAGDVVKTDAEGGGDDNRYSPPCITIKEEEGRQPIQIRLNITGNQHFRLSQEKLMRLDGAIYRMQTF